MRICIPTADGSGPGAAVFAHFGSAPCFTLLDTEGGEPEVLVNRNAHHAHGTCHPLSQLEGRGIDAIVTGGIGHRALAGLHSAGLKVYRAPRSATVADIIRALGDGSLAELVDVHACGGHGHGSRLAHGLHAHHDHDHGHDHEHQHDHDHDHDHGHGRGLGQGRGRGQGAGRHRSRGGCS
jgi:predicted Fe-Mo cluster-binding NifX family protein